MIKRLATIFNIGYLPVMPGSYASVLGIIIFFFLKDDLRILAIVTVGIAIIGLLVCGRAEEILKEKDSPKIVIDELIGMLSCCCLIKFSYLNAGLIFCFFRLIDVIKPFPIRKVEKIRGSLGIVLDDLLAAFYAVGLFYAVFYLLKIFNQ